MNHASQGYCYLKVEEHNLRQELYVTSVGCLSHPAGRPYPEPGHPNGYRFDWSRGRVLSDFAVLLISRGAGLLETRRGLSACGHGDALLIPPGVWHRYRPNVASGWREHWVCANGEYLHRLRAKGCFIAEAAVLTGGANARLLAAHHDLWAQVQRKDTVNDMVIASRALAIFAMVWRVPPAQATLVTASNPTGAPIAGAAREYIWFHSHRALGVSLIAREVGVSRRTLERCFVRTYGVTVAQELMARRIARARQLLAETQMSVKEISYAVGFGDSRRLIRNFTRASGHTPGAFRRRRSSM